MGERGWLKRELIDLEHDEIKAAVAVLRKHDMMEPCRCDPPGSGEEFCNGGCQLRWEIEQRIITSSRVAGQRDNAMEQCEQLRGTLETLQRAVIGDWTDSRDPDERALAQMVSNTLAGQATLNSRNALVEKAVVWFNSHETRQGVDPRPTWWTGYEHDLWLAVATYLKERGDV